MHEVVTLQFGQQANYVGTHFWNTQESYFTYGAEEESPVDHDVHFRPGLGADGSETFTPRTVIYDLKGAFGTLRRENALYDTQEDPSGISQQMWRGNTNVIRQDPIPQSIYQQHLDQGLSPPTLTTDTVRFWSDYNRVFYNPRSIIQLHEYELNSALMPFEQWGTGEELFNSLDREHDLLDRDLRPFLEECDQMQAIQMIASTDDAWGGFTAKYLERIQDDLGKTSTWVWGLEEGGRRSMQKTRLQTANTAQSIYNIASQASLYIPLTSSPHLPSYVSMDSTSKWHTSAIQALALETITLPTRLRATQYGSTSFDDLENVLSNDGNRKIAALSLSLEDPSAHDTSANGTTDNANGHSNGNAQDEDIKTPELDMDMHPEAPVSGGGGGARNARETSTRHIFSQVQSLRGKWESSLEIEETNRASRNRFSNAPRIQSYQSSLLFPALDSFPKVFSFGGARDKLAVRSALSASTAVAQRVRQIERLARSIVGIDEREALCDGLVSMCEEYEDGWDSDSEGDDDD